MNFWTLKKASKFKKYFSQPCYLARLKHFLVVL